ncbi:tryptophan synthase subunit alpha [Hippea maritima]|uniref:tryptophan synthase n=1 Tax=Hippea maritima (strain ATCC 700847 / DSM 10411 / MH2) TaxID=760142 RepID=F2LU59_HIPMA|nr:tryptophan synthase subunit alpha [Hippea maritima]AEA34522.1 tryptophan synthase, alpha subunit [Hippea maritima DSM 10411]
MCRIGIYLVCNYPNRDRFLDAVEMCNRYGIDFLEIGLPFSDPTADGDVIEKVSTETLKRYSMSDFLDSTRLTRQLFKGKLYIMTYANIVFSYGIDKFACDLGFIDGLILADVPYREANRFKKPLSKKGIGFVHFATPESRQKELERLKKDANDFIYFVSIRGTTGGRFHLDDETKEKLAYLKGAKHGVILGFGIRNRSDIEKACRYADGVVIGTAAVEAVNGNFEAFLLSLKG